MTRILETASWRPGFRSQGSQAAGRAAWGNLTIKVCENPNPKSATIFTFSLKVCRTAMGFMGIGTRRNIICSFSQIQTPAYIPPQEIVAGLDSDVHKNRRTKRLGSVNEPSEGEGSRVFSRKHLESKWSIPYWQSSRGEIGGDLSPAWRAEPFAKRHCAPGRSFGLTCLF